VLKSLQLAIDCGVLTMKRVDPRRTGIYLAILGAFVYIGWVVVSLVLFLKLPILRFADVVVYFDIDFAIAAIAVASASGFALGLLLASLWNWLVPRLGGTA
jgi:hypothetical protein